MKPLIERPDKKLLLASGFQVRSRLEDMGKLPLFLTISGSHSHGLERDDSDIDVRGVYLDSTEDILSLRKQSDTQEDKIGQIDYQCYEFGKFLKMILADNGNMMRMLLAPLCVYCTPLVDWLKLGKSLLTKKLRFYYRGYADGQRKRCMSERGGKALIYTYREMFEGLSVMRLGSPIFDFRELWEWVRKERFYTSGLLDTYFENYEKLISDEGWRRFYVEWELLCVELDKAAQSSQLPDDYNHFDELEELLQVWRLKGLFLPMAKSPL